MTTATKAGGAVLPVAAWENWNKYTGECWGPLTPHAPAQATIDELRAEVERKSEAIQRLWRERDAALAEVEALKAAAQEQALQYLSDNGQWLEETGRLRAEVERLTRERDELNHARNAAIERSNFMFAATRDAQDVASLANDRWAAIQRELESLKAKQIDVDAVMRLAEGYAQSVSTVDLANGEVWRSAEYRAKRVAESNAAREALRAAVTKDRT